MRAVIAHESAEGLRTWELLDARRYFHDPYWGWSVSGEWHSARLVRRMSFPLAYVEVSA